ERIECALQMSQRRLERTFRRLGEPRRLRVAFPGSEHLVGLCVGYPAMLLRPGAGTLSQRSVVDVTDAPERASKRLGLLVGRIEAVLVRPLHSLCVHT